MIEKTKSEKNAILVFLILAAALGFVLALCGCMNDKAVEACGKACGSVGVKYVTADLCQCNPPVCK